MFPQPPSRSTSNSIFSLRRLEWTQLSVFEIEKIRGKRKSLNSSLSPWLGEFSIPNFWEWVPFHKKIRIRNSVLFVAHYSQVNSLVLMKKSHKLKDWIHSASTATRATMMAILRLQGRSLTPRIHLSFLQVRSMTVSPYWALPYHQAQTNTSHPQNTQRTSLKYAVSVAHYWFLLLNRSPSTVMTSLMRLQCWRRVQGPFPSPLISQSITTTVWVAFQTKWGPNCSMQRKKCIFVRVEASWMR